METLLDRLATGKESLAAICRDPQMPGLRTVYDRIERDAEFAARFRARKAIGVRAIVDDCLEIADEEVSDAVDVQDKRVRIDTRLRLAGKWLAAEFGDKQLIGSDPDNPLPSGLQVSFVRPGQETESSEG
jgi:hypothetical protein